MSATELYKTPHPSAAVPTATAPELRTAITSEKANAGTLSDDPLAV